MNAEDDADCPAHDTRCKPGDCYFKPRPPRVETIRVIESVYVEVRGDGLLFKEESVTMRAAFLAILGRVRIQLESNRQARRCLEDIERHVLSEIAKLPGGDG